MPWPRTIWLFVGMIAIGLGIFAVVCYFMNPKGK